MIDWVVGQLAPHICNGCGVTGDSLCSSCIHDISEDSFSCCVQCVTPTASSNLCQRCRKTVAYTDAYVVSVREGVLKRLLNGYKFERQKSSAAVFATLLDNRLPVLPAHTVVTYIPTINRHIRQRGYDHMTLIAKTFASKRRLSVKPLLKRSSSQYVQHGASRPERLRQAQAAFLPATSDSYDTVLLIDDIATTGATLQSAAKILEPQITGELLVGVIARQPLDDFYDL